MMMRILRKARRRKKMRKVINSFSMIHFFLFLFVSNEAL